MASFRRKTLKALQVGAMSLLFVGMFRHFESYNREKRQPYEDSEDLMPVMTEPRTYSSNNFMAQFGQDKWLLENIFRFAPPESLFIEFGARNGISHSNTYFFEKSLGWWGLLAEAAPEEHEQIVAVRTNASIINGAICATEKPMLFMRHNGGLGGIKDKYDEQRLKEVVEQNYPKVEYQVQCYRLDRLIDMFGIRAVDFMSVDTEGSELEALAGFPFDRVPVRVISIEVLIGPGREGNLGKVTDFMKQRRYKLLHQHSLSPDGVDLFFEPDFSTEAIFKRRRFDKATFLEARQKCKAEKICL